VYEELSGFYDAPTQEFTFQAAPGSASEFWNNNIYAVSTTGQVDLVIPWGAGPGELSDCPWNEHANTDPTGAWTVWSSSHGATAGPYNGCTSSFSPFPLDRWGGDVGPKRRAFRSGHGARNTADKLQPPRNSRP
jgi:hypothetical protein